MMRVVYWGTYDVGKPRNRIMIRGLKKTGVHVIECQANIWKGVEDKSQITGILNKAMRIISLFLAYPKLVYRYLRLPPHDVVVIGYMGQFDVLIIWPFARMRGVPVCWDILISLYDTIVVDRKIVSKRSIIAFILYALEWLASRAASIMLLDTRTHAEYFEKLYYLPTHSVRHVFVGAEFVFFKKVKTFKNPKDIFTVLFYGQFIPLHGIDIIVHAAKILEKSESDIRWTLIGKGQEAARIDTLIKEAGIKSIERVQWVPYEHLINYINKADICLGIFESTGKATRVIPNKVYQILASGKPLVTGDTPAIRELLDSTPSVRLVVPGNSKALAVAVIDLKKSLQSDVYKEGNHNNVHPVGHLEVGRQFYEVLRSHFNK